MPRQAIVSGTSNNCTMPLQPLIIKDARMLRSASLVRVSIILFLKKVPPGKHIVDEHIKSDTCNAYSSNIFRMDEIQKI